eukprot:9013711-Pyramimonas_sp.AAC.1
MVLEAERQLGELAAQSAPLLVAPDARVCAPPSPALHPDQRPALLGEVAAGARVPQDVGRRRALQQQLCAGRLEAPRELGLAEGEQGLLR